ncbi:unnamed protein product [Gongylonema pulchrum]|uniref:Capsid protein n=1 Tax=Gongylonema pulchrum TaxID=637853 RepID=A0A183EAN8_9BILA|nr:unnamed protein product [Gongylonema pulchrum]
MAKQKKRKVAARPQPQRHSQRQRTVNSRLGTPPKFLQDMMKNHPTSQSKKRSLVAGADDDIGTHSAHFTRSCSVLGYQ